METHSFRRVSEELQKTLQKLCVSTKFAYQEIRWNCGILGSVDKRVTLPKNKMCTQNHWKFKKSFRLAFKGQSKDSSTNFASFNVDVAGIWSYLT